jgi:mono/diheme cytochrome c family protein
MKKIICLLSFLLLLTSLEAFAVFDFMTSSSLKEGARVYKERCILCHSQNGNDEGLISASLFSLEKPNLLKPKYSTDEHSLRNIIVWGGMKKKMSIVSPPWGDDLTWGEIESLVTFIMHLREKNNHAVKLLNNIVVTKKLDIKSGQLIYNKRCAICHGIKGNGNGRIAKTMKAPKPANLTQSKLSDVELKQIISKGGISVSRSPGMPAWKNELSSIELDSVIKYIKTFRK